MVSWIYREDLVNLILQALTRPDSEGVFNATAPVLFAWRILPDYGKS